LPAKKLCPGHLSPPDQLIKYLGKTLGWELTNSLIEDDLIKCDKVELRRCQSLMKSKKPLPKLLWSRYGSSIIMITSIDGSKEYQVITQKDYLNITQRPNGNKFKGKYAIIYPDNYLYIPDSEIKAVNVLVYTLDEKADDSSDCTECSACESYYDKEVSVPVKLLDAIIGETIKEVSFRFQVPYDSNPQGDPNQKTQTIK